MTLETDTITLPAFWACALINGDTSGMEDKDEAKMNEHMAQIEAKGWYVVDVVRDEQGNGEEARFTWSFNLHGGDAKGGDVLDYVMHRQVP